MNRIHTRDGVRFILSRLDEFYEDSPGVALTLALSRVRTLSAESLRALRRRQFGTLPNTREDALRFLARRFREHRETLAELDEDDIESVSSSSSSSSSSTATTLLYSTDSDSDRTVPIDLKRL